VSGTFFDFPQLGQNPPAGERHEALQSAPLTLPSVAAERRRAALGDGVQDTPLPWGQAVEVVRVRAHDVGQFPAAGAGRLSVHGEP